jgi:predicted RNase H-like HicB family nuclease
MTLKYSVQVVWSDEDSAFIASIPELPGCMADGSSAEAATKAVYEVAEEWIKTASEMGRAIPSPFTAGDFGTGATGFRRNVSEGAVRQAEDAISRA